MTSLLPTTQEEEARLKPGTTKAAVFAVMKDAGPVGLRLDDIQRLCTEKGLKTQWGENAKKNLASVSAAAGPCIMSCSM